MEDATIIQIVTMLCSTVLAVLGCKAIHTARKMRKQGDDATPA